MLKLKRVMIRLVMNFWLIANSLDSLIEEKTKDQSNDIEALDIISTELDGLKSVTLDTKKRKLTK